MNAAPNKLVGEAIEAKIIADDVEVRRKAVQLAEQAKPTGEPLPIPAFLRAKIEPLTQEQANLICEAHGIFELLINEEELELMENNNPELLEAYNALNLIAVGE